MIAISLIESLHGNISNSSLGAYIFCDNAIDKRNTTPAVMKSLLYQILSQQPGLLKLLLRDFEIQKAGLFSSLEAVWRILQNVLNNSSFREVYFVVDGLDECKVDSLEPFLLLIESYQHQKPSDARTNQSCIVKWLLTSRPKVRIQENLSKYSDIDLGGNSDYVAEAVNGFIDVKVEELARRKNYEEHDCTLKSFVEEALRQRSEGTFLWVALAYRALRKPTVQAFNTRSIVMKLPSGLTKLYGRIMEQVMNNEDKELAVHIKEILRSVTVAFRPLTLEELAVAAELPMEHRYNRMALIQYVNQCGSILTIRQDTVHFVHQSAKDYLLSPGSTVIFSPGLGEENKMIAYRCFQYICTDAFAEHVDDRTLSAEELEIVTRNTPYLEYPVLHWMDHGRAAFLDIAELFNLEEQFFR